MNSKLHGCIAFLIFLFASLTAGAQVTTSSIEGTVVDENDQPLPGANVVAIHEPTGTRRGVSTQSNGRFTLQNLRIGGPYTVSATFVGYRRQEIQRISLSLGQTETVNFQLSENVTALEELVISGGNEDINEGRTGAETTISSSEIENLPTITRSAEDVYRLSPSSDGNSFAGRNDQYNNFSLDGSIFNNPFGLDVSTAGGQTNAQPISLDAIDQIQVSIAPYDVTQSGFTGASVNAVTKSGTNTFKGSVFGFYRNEQFTGSKVAGSDIFVPDLTQFQSGFSLGGPIIADKLFFFANLEFDLRDDLGSNFLAAESPDQTGGNTSRVLASDLQLVSSLLSDRYDYETGAFERYSHDTDNNKGIFKLDWNISDRHSLTATYNYLDASRDLPANPLAIGRRGPDQTTLQFLNSGYQINNRIQSGIVEVNSQFGNTYANKLQVGYTLFDDSRNPFSTPFPSLNISKNGIRYIVAGHEPFSINNRLEQQVYQLTDNFNIFANDHTITIGASLEAFSFDNSFNLGSYFIGQPGGVFAGPGIPIEDFESFITGGELDAAVENAQNVFEQNNANDSWALAETNVGQAALYAQDRWNVSENFTFTYGLRVDVPLYFNTVDKIEENIARKGGTVEQGGTYNPDVMYFDEEGEPTTLSSTELPDQKPLFSPRLGFNWDLMGDQSLQLRGGTGYFTGRFPFVWIGNQVANTGTGLYQVTDPDFEFPQVWRSNVGAEKAFKGGWLLSTDLIYTKDINGVIVRNYGLADPSGSLSGADNRAYYLPSEKAANNAFVFTNTDKGRSFNWTLEVKKRFSDTFFASLAYNYLYSQDLNSIEAEISSDAFNRNPALGNVNNPELAPSLYGDKHRFVGNASKSFNYGDGMWATTISLFAELAKGGRFNYTYSGDINGDGSVLNDLIYIPTESELQSYSFAGGGDATPEQQRTAFSDYIADDEYLSDRRGQYAEKYAILGPWFSRFDLRLTQKLNLGQNSLEFSMDFLNIGNLINSDWGVRENPTNTQPIGINSVDSETLEPVYTFDPNLNNTFTNRFDLESRWRLQFGLRYSFN
jgi:hypothetical protein